MMKNTKRTIRQEKMWRLAENILIAGAVLTAALATPKFVRDLDRSLQDSDYARDHAAMKQIKTLLSDRAINSHGRVAEADPFDEALKQQLNHLEERHQLEKKNAACRYCDSGRESH